MENWGNVERWYSSYRVDKPFKKKIKSYCVLPNTGLVAYLLIDILTVRICIQVNTLSK